MRNALVRKMQEQMDANFTGGVRMGFSKLWVHLRQATSAELDIEYVKTLCERHVDAFVVDHKTGHMANKGGYSAWNLTDHDWDPEFGEGFKVASVDFVFAACIEPPWAMIVDNVRDSDLIFNGRGVDVMILLKKHGGYVVSVDVKR